MAQINPAAKGRRLVQLAKAILESQGALVEVAQNSVRWIPGKVQRDFAKMQKSIAGVQPLRPISTHHDFFGVWDLAFVFGGNVEWPRGFIQVTVYEEVSRRRAKILASGFPCTFADQIWGYKGGRGAEFVVFSGPRFTEPTGERWRPVKANSRRREKGTKG